MEVVFCLLLLNAAPPTRTDKFAVPPAIGSASLDLWPVPISRMTYADACALASGQNASEDELRGREPMPWVSKDRWLSQRELTRRQEHGDVYSIAFLDMLAGHFATCFPIHYSPDFPALVAQSLAIRTSDRSPLDKGRRIARLIKPWRTWQQIHVLFGESEAVLYTDDMRQTVYIDYGVAIDHVYGVICRDDPDWPYVKWDWFTKPVVRPETRYSPHCWWGVAITEELSFRQAWLPGR